MTRTSSPARIAGAGLAGLVAAGVLLAASPGWTGPPDRGPVYPAAHPTGDASPTGDAATPPGHVDPATTETPTDPVSWSGPRTVGPAPTVEAPTPGPTSDPTSPTCTPRPVEQFRAWVERTTPTCAPDPAGWSR